MTVQTIRIVTAPYKLQEKWVESWRTDYSSYEEWLDYLQKINILDLWDRGTYIGKMGE